MRLIKLFLFGIFLVAFWSCSDLGDPYVEAECPDGQVKDCAGMCGGLAVEDCTGECGGTNQVCLSYSTQIHPIFSANCTGCHGISGDLNLTSYANVMDGNSTNGPIIIAGDADNSILVQKISGTAGFGDRMPASSPSYFDSHQDELQLIKDWINEGAQNN